MLDDLVPAWYQTVQADQWLRVKGPSTAETGTARPQHDTATILQLSGTNCYSAAAALINAVTPGAASAANKSEWHLEHPTLMSR